MTDPGATPRRRMWKYLLVALAAGLVLFSSLAWYATTVSFQTKVRQRLITELERITGGRVELGAFHVIPFRLLVAVSDLTIHGKESADQIPFAHVDRLEARVKLISALGAEFGFSSLVLESPIVHIITYADGTSNLPQPQAQRRSDQNPVEKLFSLSIDQIEVRKGTLLLNDRKIPLDFSANDISADMSYSFLGRRYEGSLLFRRAETTFQDFRPVDWLLETHFSLGINNLEIRRLLATAGRSKLEASGNIIDFRNPNVTGSYNLTLDLGQVGAIARRAELRRGSLQAEGNGTWKLSSFSSTGKLTLEDMDWRGQPFPLRGVAGTVAYAIDPERATISRIQAQVAGGEVSGQAEVTNWQMALTNQKTSSAPKGTASLRFKNLQVSEIAAALASQARPFERLRLAGIADGTVLTRWTGSPRKGETALKVDVSPPAHSAPGQLALRAHAEVVYHGAKEDLEVHTFEAETPSTSVRAEGNLSSRSAMRFSFHTTDLAEWQKELPGLGYEEQIPVVLRGSASFEGNASGSISAIHFTGKLESQNFNFVMPSTAHVPQKRIEWDSLTADLQFSPTGVLAHNGTLRRGNTILSFDGTAGLHNREFISSSPFAAHLSVKDGDIGAIQQLVGYDYPVSGIASFTLEAGGTEDAPHAAGRIEAANAVVYGESIPHFASKLEFADQQINVKDVRMSYYGAPIAGTGSYNFSTHAFHCSAQGSGFDLAKFPRLQTSRLTTEGKLDFVVEGDGTPDAPVMNIEAHVHGLTLDHELAGDYTFNALTHGADMHVTGRSEFKASDLDIDGDVTLRNDWPSHIVMHFNHLDLDALLRSYLHGELTGHSAAEGQIELTGPLRKPRQLQATGDLANFSADVEHLQVRNKGPIQFSTSGEVLNIQQLQLTGQNTDLSLAGSLDFSDDNHVLKLHANGQTDLQLIETFDPDFTSSGTLTMDVDVGGTIARPSLHGTVRVNNGTIAYSGLSTGISELNGSLAFTQDRLQIETLTAQVGGGTVSFGGYITAYNKQLSYDLTLQGREVRVRYLPGLSSVLNVDLRFSGRPSSATLSGDATITRATITPGFDFASYVISAQGSALPQTNPLLNRIHLDVHIVTLPELQMQTASMHVSGDADLHVRGTAAKPVVLGRADIIEGLLNFNGAKYRVERGDVTFTNPVTTTPVLDLQASTRVKYYDITVNLNGGFDKLNLSYHSEPPLPSADIVNLLALGQTREESAQLQATGQQTYAAQASSVALAEALNSALSSRSRSLFGISHIKIDPQGLNTETSPTTTAPAVTIEQQVKDNLTITYTTDVSQTSEQIIQAEYNLSKNLSILALRDYNGVVSFELRFRQRRR
jgi:translocation and assembly module TamB